MSTLSEAIHEAAAKLGSLEALRRRAKLSNDGFYPLAKGEPWKTRRTLQKLKKAGVEISEDLLSR